MFISESMSLLFIYISRDFFMLQKNKNKNKIISKILQTVFCKQTIKGESSRKCFFLGYAESTSL